MLTFEMITWVLMGLFVGFVRDAYGTPTGSPYLRYALGGMGGFAGGWLARLMVTSTSWPAGRYNWVALTCAAIGGALVLVAYWLATTRRRTA